MIRLVWQILSIRLKRLIRAALGVFLISVPWAAKADTEYGKTIAYVGTNNGYAYLHFTAPLSAPCNGDIAYIDLSTPTGMAAYSLALTARAMGTAISRIDYTVSGGTCYIALLQG